jgi:hypothetical protein
MSLSLGERLLVPLLIAGIFALLSFGFMFGVRGASRRMKSVGLCSTLFIVGTIYCMFWHEQLSAITGWENAWIGASALVATGSIYLCKTLLARQAKRDESENETPSSSNRL